MRIIFMGTSDFGSETLKKLLSLANHQIIAIYTKPPSVSGRGNKLQISAIHQIANSHNLKVFTPKTLRDPQVQNEFAQLEPDIAIVISYGLILPQEILDIPRFGCYNIHPSKLPLYRGSAPLQRSLMNGEEDSAVCIIKMDAGLDSGDIVKQRDFKILPNDDFTTISTKTSIIGAELMIESLSAINSLKFIKQDANLATYAKKIEKYEGLIDWNSSGKDIINKIRALRGNLCAHFNYKNEKIKILEAEFLKGFENLAKQKLPNGTIIDAIFSIKCPDGVITPTILQRQGKNPLKINEFLNGFKINISDILG